MGGHASSPSRPVHRRPARPRAAAGVRPITAAATATRPAATLRPLAPALLALAAAALALLTLFHAEAAAALHVWLTSTAFGHCFLVLPIALYLAYERRDRLSALLNANLRPQPLPAITLLILPLALVWLGAERLGLMEGRQFMALAMLQVLAYALLGPRFWRAMAAPLLYLFFLVPFGGFATPLLQSFTAHFIDAGLAILEIPHLVTATVIETPAGIFRVAEACAGLRFLIASIAFGVLYACTLYRSPGRRLGFVAASILVPILANGCRALGIVLLGQLLGDAQAATVDHIVYGWLFFSAVTLLLILAGLPFREDRPGRRKARGAAPGSRWGQGTPDPMTKRDLAWSWGLGSPDPNGGSGATPLTFFSPARLGTAAGVGLLLAAAGPVGAGLLDRPGGERPLRVPLVVPAGCTRIDPGQVACGAVRIVVRAASLDAASTPQRLLAAARALAGLGTVVTAHSVGAWQLVETEDPARVYATCFRLSRDGSAATGLAWRLAQAKASTFGTTPDGWRPTLIAASVQDPSLPEAASVLETFLAAQPAIIPADRTAPHMP